MENLNDKWTIEYNSNNSLPLYAFCSFPITKNIYFFETKLLVGNKIQVGFVTRLAQINQVFETENIQSTVFKTVNSFSNDIFGFLINVEQKTIKFYYNGNLTDVQINTNIFNFKPFFAVFEVTQNHKMHFNFGQTTFEYPPCEINFKTFYSTFLLNKTLFKKKFEIFQIKYKNLKKNSFELDKNFIYNCNKSYFENSQSFYFNFYEFQFNFEIPVLFSDTKQIEFDQAIIKINKMINDEINYNEIKTFVHNIILKSKTNYSLIRFFQSIIEITNKVVPTDKFYLFENCIMFILDSKELYNSYFKEKYFQERMLLCHSFFVCYFSQFEDININNNNIHSKIYFFVYIFSIFQTFLRKYNNRCNNTG